MPRAEPPPGSCLRQPRLGLDRPPTLGAGIVSYPIRGSAEARRATAWRRARHSGLPTPASRPLPAALPRYAPAQCRDAEIGRPDTPRWGDSRQSSSVPPRRPREGPLTEPTADAQPWPRERVLMPLSRPPPLVRERAIYQYAS